MSKTDINTFYKPKQTQKEKDDPNWAEKTWKHWKAVNTMTGEEQKKALKSLEKEEEEEFDIICGCCNNGGQYDDGSCDDNHERCDDCGHMVCFKKETYANDDDGNLYCKYCIPEEEENK